MFVSLTIIEFLIIRFTILVTKILFLIMRLDTLSSLAEIMPFWGTLDQTYKIIGALNKRTQEIWKKWRVQFGRIIKRKETQMKINSFLKLIWKNDQEIILVFSIFKISEIEIKTIDHYIEFSNCISKWSYIDLVQIKDAYLYLSKSDNFDSTYKRIWTRKAYNEEDRKVDAEYNKLIEIINQSHLHIDHINSYLYIDELQSRDILFIDKLVYILDEDSHT